MHCHRQDIPDDLIRTVQETMQLIVAWKANLRERSVVKLLEILSSHPRPRANYLLLLQ